MKTDGTAQSFGVAVNFGPAITDFSGAVAVQR
jgi:hypothetical protein